MWYAINRIIESFTELHHTAEQTGAHLMSCLGIPILIPQPPTGGRCQSQYTMQTLWYMYYVKSTATVMGSSHDTNCFWIDIASVCT